MINTFKNSALRFSFFYHCVHTHARTHRQTGVTCKTSLFKRLSYNLKQNPLLGWKDESRHIFPFVIFFPFMFANENGTRTRKYYQVGKNMSIIPTVCRLIPYIFN